MRSMMVPGGKARPMATLPPWVGEGDVVLGVVRCAAVQEGAEPDGEKRDGAGAWKIQSAPWGSAARRRGERCSAIRAGPGANGEDLKGTWNPRRKRRSGAGV